MGKTSLYLAVEYACGTVQIEMRGKKPSTIRGFSHPRQSAHDNNALQVVERLLRACPQALLVEEFVQGAMPLHRLVVHNGPGRQETLRTIIEAMDNGMQGDEVRLQSNNEALIGATQQYRRQDHMTPLHLACVADHFDETIVRTLARADPSSIALINRQGKTALHLLCDMSPSKEHIRLRLIEKQQALTELITELALRCNSVVRIKDSNKRLPIHCYLESALIAPKRPEVIRAMLDIYPESAWIPHPTLGPLAGMITSYALLSSRILDTRLDYTHLARPGNPYKDEEEDENNLDEYEPIVDPNLLCLLVILNHWHVHQFGPERANEAARDSVTALRLFIHLSPLSTLQERICGNSLKCVLRLVVASLFQAQYRYALLRCDPDISADNFFLHSLVTEWKAISTSKTMDLLSHRVAYLIRNDALLVTMVVCLPSFDSDLFAIMFPTYTPEWFAGCHRICPIFVAFGFVKWCKDRQIPVTFNLPLAAEALQLPTRKCLIDNARLTLDFFKENFSYFDPTLVQGVGAFARSIIDGDDNDDDGDDDELKEKPFETLRNATRA